MNFRLGNPPLDIVELRNARLLMVEPIEKMVLYGSAIGVLFVCGLFYCFGLLGALYKWTCDVSLLGAITTFVGVMLSHEVLHMLAYQGLSWNRRGTFGFSLKAMTAYAYFPFVVTRNRFLLVALFPTIILTLIPFALILSGLSSSPYLLPVAGLNALFCGGDLYIFFITLKNVPTGKSVQSSGIAEYWGDAG